MTTPPDDPRIEAAVARHHLGIGVGVGHGLGGQPGPLAQVVGKPLPECDPLVEVLDLPSGARRPERRTPGGTRHPVMEIT